MTSDSFEGHCSFRLMPEDDLTDGPSSATVVRVGEALVLHYTWTHPADGPQRGVLLCSAAGEAGVAEASLFDTWHQQPGLMQLTGTRAGDHVEVAATYAGEWGWQIEVTVEDDSAAMTMRNVVPASAVADRSVESGPYDVMVAQWSAA